VRRDGVSGHGNRCSAGKGQCIVDGRIFGGGMASIGGAIVTGIEDGGLVTLLVAATSSFCSIAQASLASAANAANTGDSTTPAVTTPDRTNRRYRFMRGIHNSVT